MKRLLASAVAALFLAVPAHTGAQAPRTPSASGPKLVVMIAVDQMRGDYPVRYASLLSKGLKRLTTEGAWFTRAAYPYLNTYTCVGHHTIGTGTFPYHHGIMQNSWYDRASEKTVTCTSDPSVTNHLADGPAPGMGDSDSRNQMPSLADIMRRDLNSRVVSMSMKARAAIGLAGHGGYSVVWIDDKGVPETSTAYNAPEGLSWATAFAKANPASRDAGKTWERTLPADRYQYADDLPGETPGMGWGPTFPHALGSAGDRTYIDHWESSPYADQYLEQMAEAAVDELKLGQEDRVDFLGISFSALDHVGHVFGPRSQEVQDILVNLDATLGKLIDHLDEKVGAGRYVLALSADHGAADVPEQVQGGRVMAPTVTAGIEGALKPFFGDGPFVAENFGNDVYFKPGVYDRIVKNPQAMDAVRAAILKVPGVARVITTAEVSAPGARTSKDAILRAAALSYYPNRTGDLIVVTKPNVIYGKMTTTHGSANEYDQHVPVIFYGAGVKAGRMTGPASPADIAPTLGSLVGVKLPAPDGHVQSGALQPSGSKTASR